MGGHGPAAAFAHPDLRARRRFQFQTQRGRRCVGQVGAIAEHESESLPGDRGHLQATQGAIVGVMRPRQHGGAASRSQALLGGPEHILLAGIHDFHAAHVDAVLAPASDTRRIRRRHDHHVALALGQSRERGQHQAKFAHAIDRQQDLGQRSLGPTACGQHGIECAPPGGLIADRHLGGTTTPDLTCIEQGGEWNHGAHQLPRNRPANRPSIAKSSVGSTSMGLKPGTVRHQPDHIALPVQALDGETVAVHTCGHDLAVTGHRRGVHRHQIAIQDAFVAHRVADHFHQVVRSQPEQRTGHAQAAIDP